MNVAVIGSGYVGLVTGVCLASAGHKVACVDTQSARIDAINESSVPFFEPGLPELLKRTIGNAAFRGTTDLQAAVADAEVIIIAVGTPSGEGRIDFTAMEAALSSIGKALALFDDVKTIVIKSTVVPGTTDTLAREVLERTSGKIAGPGFGLVMNPEFLREGTAVEDFTNPDRVVIGAYDERSGDVVEHLYSSYACPKLRTSPRNAELIKYASNALLATLISFSNEIAAICETVKELDAEVVMDGLHLDKRWTPIVGGDRIRPEILTYLRAGAGFGGSCLPKDVAALLDFGSKAGVAMPLLQAALDINAARPARLVEMLREELGELRDRRIVLLGLAFKPGTDDLRESAALRVADLLFAEGAKVRAIDPVAMNYAPNSLDSRIAMGTDPAATLRDTDAAVLMTAWPQFETWEWPSLVKVMRTPLIVDGRNALRRVRWPPGTRYRPIGRAHSALPEVLSVG